MNARALIGAGTALGLAVGIGLGYLMFHNDSTSRSTPPAQKAAATSAPSSAETFPLSGSLTLQHGAFLGSSASGTCAGYKGYDDITTGAGVAITDQAGTVVATGTLDAGTAQDVNADYIGSCKFTFTVPVPTGKTFYGVQVTHRGVVQFSSDKAKAGDVALSLGGS